MKKKVLTILYIVILIVFIYLFQLFVINNNTLFGAKPNLILISVIVVSLWYGLHVGAFYSLITGIITDFVFMNSYGIFTISYLIVGILIGYLSTTYMKENKISLIYITMIATATFEMVQYFIYLIGFGVASNLFYVIKQILVSSLLNIVIVYILYGVFSKITSYLDSKFNSKRVIF